MWKQLNTFACPVLRRRPAEMLLLLVSSSSARSCRRRLEPDLSGVLGVAFRANKGEKVLGLGQ